jgi:hypothetical protein
VLAEDCHEEDGTSPDGREDGEVSGCGVVPAVGEKPLRNPGSPGLPVPHGTVERKGAAVGLPRKGPPPPVESSAWQVVRTQSGVGGFRCCSGQCGVQRDQHCCGAPANQMPKAGPLAIPTARRRYAPTEPPGQKAAVEEITERSA